MDRLRTAGVATASLGVAAGLALAEPGSTSAAAAGPDSTTSASAPAAARPLGDLSEAFASVAARVKPSVVYITATRSARTAQAERMPQLPPAFLLKVDATGLTPAALGISVRDASPEDAAYVGLPSAGGVVVQDFSGEDSPALEAGLRPGDVIVAVDGEPVEYVSQLQERIAFREPGEVVALEVARNDGARATVRVAHGGTLELARSDALGTEFRLTLPPIPRSSDRGADFSG